MPIPESLPRVPDSELDYERDLVFTHEGVPFSGIGYEERSDLGLSEVSYRDGMQHGVSRDWFPSGKLKGESRYRENSLHGTTRELDEDGHILMEIEYEYGIVVSSRELDDHGNEIRSFEIETKDRLYAMLERLRTEKAWRSSDEDYDGWAQ